MNSNGSPSSTGKTSEEKEKAKSGFFLSRLRDMWSNDTPNPRVWSGKTVNDVPNKQLVPAEETIVAAFSAPNESLTYIQTQHNKRRSFDEKEVNVGGVSKWNERPNQAYGILTSLYDRNMKQDCTVGDPIADCLSIVVRPNNSILVLADGVSWGEKSKLAAWSAVYGCTCHLLENLSHTATTRDVFICLMSGFQNAQTCIIEEDSTLTTLCAAVVVQLKDRKQWGLCIVNVGDSLAYVYNTLLGVREVTTGSHPLDECRDMKNAGGALGPVDGHNPDLANLTCSYTLIEDNDIIFLTSDGVSDNYDPGVALFVPSSDCLQKFCPTQRKGSAFGNELKSQVEKYASKSRSTSFTGSSTRPTLTPLERHCGSLEKMTKVIEESKDVFGSKISAINVCASLVNFAVQNTQQKREIHESMDLDAIRTLPSKERRQKEDEHRLKLEEAPGKLDHASIVALQVGYYPNKLDVVQSCWPDVDENDYDMLKKDDLADMPLMNDSNGIPLTVQLDDVQMDILSNGALRPREPQVAQKAFCAIK